MWQPIETAPRDATAILVMRDIWPGAKSGRAKECNGRNTYVAAWWPDERGGQGAWICYMDAVLDPECPVEPTHWMPLPDAPSAHPAPSVPTALLVAVANLVAQMEIVSRVGFVDTPNDKDSCAAFCVAEGTWLELMSAVESLASALAAAPEAKP